MQRLGLALAWLLGVLGRQYRALTTQDFSTPMTQSLVDAVVGPAALTHISVGVRVQVRVPVRRLDVVGLIGGFVVLVLVLTHGSSVAPGPPWRQGRTTRGEASTMLGHGGLSADRRRGWSASGG